MGLQGVTRGDKGLQGIQGVTRGYKGLQILLLLLLLLQQILSSNTMMPAKKLPYNVTPVNEALVQH